MIQDAIKVPSNLENRPIDLKLVVEGTCLLILLESDGKLTIPFPESYQTCHNDEMILPDIQVRIYVKRSNS